VVPLVEVALDVRGEDAVQGDDLVAERAGCIGDGVGAAEEVEDVNCVGLRGKGVWEGPLRVGYFLSFPIWLQVSRTV
jgi:hypothetical protein